MKPLCLIITILSFMLCHTTTADDDDLIQQSCKIAADGDKALNYTFCVSTLQASPKSKGSSDLSGLANVALDLASNKATSIKSTIATLKSDPKVDKMALQDCDDLFSDAVEGLGEAARAFGARDYGTALNELSASVEAGGTCEEGFQEKKALSPLSEDDGDYTQLNLICLDFINQLK